MFLTLSDLEKNNACRSGKNWFERHFPNGADLLTIINEKTTTNDFLWWGYSHLPSDQISLEEKETFFDKLKIINSDGVYESCEVECGKGIINSQKIKDSECVYYSTNVTNSDSIKGSLMVSGSKSIFDSNFVTNSSQIYLSNNITNSHNICYSDFVIESSSIFSAKNIENSSFIYGFVGNNTIDLKDCHFVTASSHLNHCMFCSDATNKDYCVFNHDVSESQWNIIREQFKIITEGFAANYIYQGEWEEKTYPLNIPVITSNPYFHYKNFSKEFAKWITTLPHYNEQIIRRLYLDQFIEKKI